LALIVQKDLDALVLEAVAAGADPRLALTHAEHDVDPALGLDAAGFARLVAMQAEGALTATQAKAVLADMQATGRDPGAIASERGYQALAGDEVGAAVDGVIADQPDAWAKFVAGDDKPLGFLVGQVMKATRGRADGATVTDLLRGRAGR
jgi:aspartyl-tRNA(Asn)/glutamyl-tRNA(Gln) amidotransferase subunit B